MNIFSTSFLSAVSTGVRIICSFVVYKFVVITGGASAIASLGSLQNYLGLSQVFSGGMYQTAVTKFVSGKEGNHKHVLADALFLAFIQSIFVSSVLVYFSSEVTKFVFGDASLSFVVKAWAFSLPFSVISCLLFAQLNGIRSIPLYISLNITTSIVNLCLVIFGGMNYGLIGVLVGFLSFNVFMITPILYFTYAEIRESFRVFKANSSKYYLLNFSMITLFSIGVSNLTLIVLREGVISDLGIDAAGHWQGVWNLSQLYLSFLAMAMSTYLLPTFSSLKWASIRMEMIRALKLVLPFALLTFLVVSFLGGSILEIIYSEEFHVASCGIAIQFLGNVFKSISWLMGILLIAKGKVFLSVVSEIITASSFILFFELLSKSEVVNAPYLSYVASAIVHLFIMVFFVYKILKSEALKKGYV